jgi:hypothetical protein
MTIDDARPIATPYEVSDPLQAGAAAGSTV